MILRHPHHGDTTRPPMHCVPDFKQNPFAILLQPMVSEPKFFNPDRGE
jgi:hypothetical protein